LLGQQGKKPMKILNPNVKRDLEEGRAIKLDLGGGDRRRKGFYSVDHLDFDGVDVMADLNKPLDLLPNDCVEYIYSWHTLEHIRELLPLMREIHRLTKPNGTIELIVPHFSNAYGYSDPTHVRFFGLYSMYYFVSPVNQPKIRKVPAFYTDVRFRIKSVRIEFFRSGIINKLFSPLLSNLINRNIFLQDFYERRLSSLFHACQIRYLMQPEK
jgi:hypothetical protein